MLRNSIYLFLNIRRDGPAIVNGEIDKIDVRELYDGKENSLNIDFEKRIKFTCSFDNIKNYPFGKQECGLYFYLSGADNKLTDLRPEKLVDQGPRDLGQYIVETWRIAAAREEYTGKKVVRVTMTLSREGRIISFSSQSGQ